MSALALPSAFLTADELVALHDEALLLYVGRPGILHPDCVERAIAAAWHAEEYTGGTVPGLVFAGFLLYYLTTDHCFRDGNKGQVGSQQCISSRTSISRLRARTTRSTSSSVSVRRGGLEPLPVALRRSVGWRSA